MDSRLESCTRALLAVVSLIMICSGCAHKVSPETYTRNYGIVKDSAQKHLAAGENGAAYVLSRVLMDSDPKDEEAKLIRDKALVADPKLESFERRKLLGSNFALRESRKIGPVRKLLLWPLNLCTDLLDVVSIEAGPCLGVGVKAHATDAVGLGAQISAGQTTLGVRGRSIGARATVENYVDLLPIEFRALAESAGGTNDAYAISYAGAGAKSPKDRPYQRARDYWSIGAQAEVGIVAANVEVHPVQLWDWITGLFFVDGLNDNVGSTKSIKLDNIEKEAIKSLLRDKPKES